MNQKSRFLAGRLGFGFWVVIPFLVNSCAAADYWYEACAPKMCGNVRISYPFYIKGNQESYCLPRFNTSKYEVNCSIPATPLIYIADNYFVLDTISYETNTLRVHVDGIASSTDCLPQFRNSTYNQNVAVSTESSLQFLSNCTAQLPVELLKYQRNLCGMRVSGSWVLVMLGDDENLETAKAECKTNVVLPVETTPGEENGVVDFVELLKKGFQVRWTAYDCKDCMDSGGRCGLDESTFLFQCFCPDKPHRVRCQHRKFLEPSLCLSS